MRYRCRRRGLGPVALRCCKLELAEVATVTAEEVSSVERCEAMSTAGTVIIKLSDLVDGQEATCFAALLSKSPGRTKANQPFLKCVFRDKRASVEAALWHDSRFIEEAEQWVEGSPYRIQVRGKFHLRYGMQMELLSIRPVTDQDAAQGFDFSDLYESSQVSPEDNYQKLKKLIDLGIENPLLRRLVEDVLETNVALFKKMPAAQGIHHCYTGGLLEHVWSMTRIASFLADHYGKYYDKLNPPLNKGLVIAATVLHDIGKVRELAYHPVATKYTTEGRLIGHILMGRDMIRDAARKIEDFPEELLMNLEHAILAHHGRKEFGSPVLPQTMEALLVSYVDDLDSKMNVMACERMNSRSTDPFTDRVFALDYRQIYKGVPEEQAFAGFPTDG
jgi:3'-5' exoribonuclease